MIIFGVLFIGLAIFNIVRVIKNIRSSHYQMEYDEENQLPIEECHTSFEEYKEKNAKPVTYCPFCRKTVSITDRFCKQCGTKLK